MVRVRTEREIELIAESCQIVADTLDMLTSYVKPGMDLLELDSMAEENNQCSNNYHKAFSKFYKVRADIIKH